MAIAKITKDGDDYSVEIWEHIALKLATQAGINVAKHELQTVDGRHVLISWRFDRKQEKRIPFLSAMSLIQARDGDRASYPEIVDELSQHGANTKAASSELFRQMIFNILVSNVDDDLRNHGFLWVPNDVDASFYRTAAGAEIDLILEFGIERWAIEIKHSSVPKPSRGFYEGSRDVSATRRIVLYPGTEACGIKDGVEVLPVTHFMHELVARR